MADIAKAIAAIARARALIGPDHLPEVNAELQAAWEALKAEPFDASPLHVLSDFLKDHGAHALLSAAEDPVKELLALREQKWRSIELTEDTRPDLEQRFWVDLKFEGLTAWAGGTSRGEVLARSLRMLATELDARAAGERVPGAGLFVSEIPPRLGVVTVRIQAPHSTAIGEPVRLGGRVVGHATEAAELGELVSVRLLPTIHVDPDPVDPPAPR